MANFETTQDLRNGALGRAGELSDGTSDFDALATTYINSIYQSVISGGSELGVKVGEDWIWARAKRPIYLQLLPKYNTGTVTVTQGSVAATLSAASAASLAGYHVKIEGRPEVFKIAFHTAATTGVTFETPYTDTSSGGLSFTAFKVDYDLVDDNFIVDSQNKYLNFNVRGKTDLTFSADFVALNVINLNINGTAISPVTFTTSQANTASLLAAEIALNTDIGSATVDGGNNRIIHITSALSGVEITLTSIVVTLGASQATGTPSITQTAAERTVTLTPGYFTSTTLASTLEIALETAVSTEAAFTVSFDSDTRKFTVSHNSVLFNIMFSSGTNSRKSLSSLMGYAVEDLTGTTTYDSTISRNAIARLVDPLVVHKPQDLEANQTQQIVSLDTATMSREWAMTYIIEGVPSYFCEINRSSSGIYTIRFNKFPTDRVTVEVPYIPVPIPLTNSVNSIPIIPHDYRRLLEFGASYFIMTDKNDDGAQGMLQLAQAALQGLLSSHQKQDMHTQGQSSIFIPRRDKSSKIRRRILRTTSGIPIS